MVVSAWDQLPTRNLSHMHMPPSFSMRLLRRKYIGTYGQGAELFLPNMLLYEHRLLAPP